MPSPEAEAFILAHADRPYDAAKAHEYYMRRRQLIGRKPAAQFSPKGRPSAGAHFGAPKPKKTQANKTAHQRQKEIEAKIGLMKVRLAKLQKVLDDLIKKAKTETDKAKPKTGKEASADKKLTGSEKSKAAKASKDYYEKHKKDKQPSSETDDLQRKIETTLKKIEAARVKLSKSNSAKPVQFTKAT